MYNGFAVLGILPESSRGHHEYWQVTYVGSILVTPPWTGSGCTPAIHAVRSLGDADSNPGAAVVVRWGLHGQVIGVKTHPNKKTTLIQTLVYLGLGEMMLVTSDCFGISLWCWWLYAEAMTAGKLSAIEAGPKQISNLVNEGGGSRNPWLWKHGLLLWMMSLSSLRYFLCSTIHHTVMECDDGLFEWESLWRCVYSVGKCCVIDDVVCLLNMTAATSHKSDPVVKVILSC